MLPALNQIFIGPPGTGKTFHVRSEVEKIVNAYSSSSQPAFQDKEDFKRLTLFIRHRYPENEYRAKGNSLYRNERKIMQMLGYLCTDRVKTQGSLSKSDAYDLGCKQGSSYWAQISQFITQFGLVNDWRDTTHIVLNSRGIKLREIVESAYSVEAMLSWPRGEPIPESIQAFYRDLIADVSENEFTPILRTFYCALHMAVEGALYKQDSEARDPTSEERAWVEKYFDTNEIADIKWVGHLARILVGLGVAQERAPTGSTIFFDLTPNGNALVKKILKSWRKLRPEIFDPIITYDVAHELGYVDFLTFHQSYSYEEFIEGIRPELNSEGEIRYELRDGILKLIASRARSNNKQNYVLVIDEINRGNVSKIFGELITLVEDTKRLGSQEYPQQVRLPYSQKLFGIPSNLFIIGTMNTADKSIVSLDLALRRRFAFVEFPPKEDLLADFEHLGFIIKPSEILRAINERLEFLQGKDYLIGHAYLMGANDWNRLCLAFRTRIIPLLLELFLNDWKKVQLVLGDGLRDESESCRFILRKQATSTRLFGSEYEFEDGETFTINPALIEDRCHELSIEIFTTGFKV